MSILLLLAAKLLIFLFLFGIVGSLVVILVTLIEDLELLLHDEESKEHIG